MNEKDPYESLACNCVEVGTVIREDDTVLTLDLCGPDAHSRFDALHTAAVSVGSGNCQASCETVDENGQTVVRATFNFDCTAEKLIFQMKNIP